MADVPGGDAHAFAQLRNSFGGEIVVPEDRSYDDSRTLFNAMIDKRPAVIAKCASAADVGASIRFARERGFEIAVRAGGHSVAGMSSTDGGVVIDVRPLKRIEIDASRMTARVGAGVTWGEFDRAAQEHGLAVTGGRVSTTGVAGFTLGGGSGWIERTYGLACDNLRGVRMVLADGRVVHASRDEHADLFWALHGGGGNFGVATELEFDLHPVGPIVLAGLMAWPANVGPELLPFYRDLSETSPVELGSGYVCLTGPPEEFVPPELVGQPLHAIAICWIGDIAEGEEVIAPLRSFGPPPIDLVGPMPYAEFQCMIDDPPGMRNYWGAEYLAGLDTDAMAVFLKWAENMPRPLSQQIVFPWGGAVAAVTDVDTPMHMRDAAWVYHPFGVWESAEEDKKNIAWARQAGDAMRPHATGGIYLNFIGDEGTDRVKAAYGETNYNRLAEIKAKYDPDNVFHLNQNIRPAVRAGT